MSSSNLHRRRRAAVIMFLRAAKMAAGNMEALTELYRAARAAMYVVAEIAGEPKYYEAKNEKRRARLAEDLLEEALRIEQDSEI